MFFRLDFFRSLLCLRCFGPYLLLRLDSRHYFDTPIHFLYLTNGNGYCTVLGSLDSWTLFDPIYDPCSQ